MNIMKKKFLAGLLAAALTLSLAACTENTKKVGTNLSSPSLEQTDFNLGHLNSTAHLLAFVAKEQGYFEEEGLNVTLTQFASAGELSAGLESGKLDVAFIGSVPTLTFQSTGHDLTIFGGAMSNGHGYVIKPEFAKGKDELDITILKGRNVASVKNSIQDAELLILLQDAGLEIGEGKDKVNIVYFDSQKDAYTAMQSKEIDAASVYSPYASLAKDAGYKVIYYCNKVEQFQNQPCCRQVASTSALAEKPKAYHAFERALIKAYNFTQENKEGTVKAVKQYIDIEEKYIEYEVYGGHADSNPDPDKQATIKLKNEIVKSGYTEDYDIEKLYNTDIYKKALKSLLDEEPNNAHYQSLHKHFDQYE